MGQIDDPDKKPIKISLVSNVSFSYLGEDVLNVDGTEELDQHHLRTCDTTKNRFRTNQSLIYANRKLLEAQISTKSGPL